MGEKSSKKDTTASEMKGVEEMVSKLSEKSKMDSMKNSQLFQESNNVNSSDRVFNDDEKKAIEMEKETLKLYKIEKLISSTVGKPCYMDVDKLIERHLTPTKDITIFYYYEEIDYILSQMIDIFKSMNTLVETKGPIVVCGDIHGQFSDLQRIFKKFGMPNKKKYIFLGDYVDRGNNSLEVINLLFLLKIKYKDNFHILRGNHELQHINKVYGFYDELCERFEDRCISEDIYMRYNEIFKYLPLAGCIGGKILCMHGGISMDIKSLDCIRNISRPLSTVTGIACDLLWADPDNTISGVTFNDLRGVSIKFGKVALNNFCNRLNIDLVIRGHQVCPIGYALFDNGKLITVFSASDYDEDMKNVSGVIYINKDVVIPISVKCPKTEKEKDPEVKKRQKYLMENSFESNTL